MKTLQMVLSLVILGVAGAFIYQHVISNSMDLRVRETSLKVEEQGTRIEAVGKRVASQEAQLQSHGEGLEEARKVNEGQGQDIAYLKQRVQELETRIAGMEASSSSDRKEIEKFRQELKSLQAAYRKNLEEADALRAEAGKRQQWEVEVEQRLKAIEKKLGVEKPQP
ncbi:MAG: hypothetical protein HY717_03880 [Planctomycetes bacterium]|nr:hypothetical protein [Planctomycetota bacterium]